LIRKLKVLNYKLNYKCKKLTNHNQFSLYSIVIGQFLWLIISIVDEYILDSVKCIWAHLYIVHITYTVTNCAHMHFFTESSYNSTFHLVTQVDSNLRFVRVTCPNMLLLALIYSITLRYIIEWNVLSYKKLINHSQMWRELIMIGQFFTAYDLRLYCRISSRIVWY